MQEWIQISWQEIAGVLLSVTAVYATIIVFTRVTGLRSFSKMSAGDFAMTVAVGSVLGSAVVTPSPTILVTAVALAGLFGGQWLLAHARRKSDRFMRLVDNRPLLLVWNGDMLKDNMRRAGVTETDIRAKLREANTFRLDDVAAVVFETTGDVSVLHGSAADEFDDFVLADVRAAP